MRNLVRGTLDTYKLGIFKFFGVYKIDYVLLTVQQPQPAMEVFNQRGGSVEIVLEATPFCLEAKDWGKDKWYKWLCIGLQVVLGTGAVTEKTLKELLHPDAPNGREVAFFRAKARKKPYVRDPK